MRFYQVNRPDVVMESFEGEVILVHMKSGNYYSLQGSAPLIWDCINHGHSLEEISDQLAPSLSTDEHQASKEHIRGSIEKLVEELVAEDLVVPVANAFSSASGQTPGTMKSNGQFMPPVLERYTDMQELLLLDPIHDVDETGWPRRKVQGEG
jgi:hypothetical protein